MLFIDETGVVSRIHENAIPHDTTRIEGGDDVLAVLEVNAGIVDMFGIETGTQIQHPGFEQEKSVWPCD